MSQDQLRERLLDVGFGSYEGSFADGQSANNKLELDYAMLSKHPELCNEVVTRLTDLAEIFNPQFIMGVPDGATGFAAAVAARIRLQRKIYNPVLTKDGTTQAIDYRGSMDRSLVMALSTGVLIEDVLNRRSTTERVLRISGLAPKITTVIGIFDRSLPEERIDVGKPVYRLAAQEIPAVLTADSELWNRLKASRAA
jgi:hypothetical protein